MTEPTWPGGQHDWPGSQPGAPGGQPGAPGGQPGAPGGPPTWEQPQPTWGQPQPTFEHPQPSWQQPATGIPGDAGAPPGWYATGDGRTLWWDGYQWHDQAVPGPSVPFRGIDGLATAITISLAVAAVAAAVTAWSYLSAHSLLQKIHDNPFSANLDDVRHADDLMRNSGRFDLGVTVVTGILVCIWLYRAFKNLHGPLRAGGLDFSPGWSVGWWFIPFANLVMPFRVMREAWSASAVVRAGRNPGVTRDTPPPILGFWWAALLCGGFLARISVSMRHDGASFDGFQTGLMVGVAGCVLTIAAAVMLILIVRSITERQAARLVSMQVPLTAP